MNDEKNTTDNSQESSGANPENTFTTDNASGTDTNSGVAADDYYAVDHAKKDVISTIGDGEMHNEGLVGTGDTSAIDADSQEIDEQDAAEMRDTEQ